MLKKITPYLGLGIFWVFTQAALPDTKLQINSQGNLDVINANGKVVKSFSLGSVGETIDSDGQSFKLSYGKDLQGRPTIIAYPSAGQNKALALGYQNSAITVSPNAVLTISGNPSGDILQTGLLGNITLDGQKIPAQSTASLNGTTNILPAAAIPATSNPAPTPPTISANSEPASQSPASEQHTKIKFVWGNVWLSQDGGTEAKLTKNSAIKAGSTIRTDNDGEVQLSFFPHTSTAIDKWSKLTIKELAYTKNGANGEPYRKLLAYLESGNVVSKLNTKDNGVTDYVIQTPTHTFTANGTRFVVQHGANGTTISVLEGIVTAADGTQIPSGYKGIFVANQQPVITPLTSDELMALNQLLNQGSDIRLGSYGNLQDELHAAVYGAQQAFSPRLNAEPITPVTP